jgi:hypothetical protein
MLRRVLLVLVGVAVSAMLTPTRAADGDLSGNWQLSTVGLNGESTVCILKIETKDGKPTASILFAPENIETKVADFRVTESRVLVTLRQTRTLGKQTVTSEVAFVGVRGNDAKVISGSTGTATARARAKLTATNKETLGKDELLVRTPVPEPMAKAIQLNNKMVQAQSKVLAEKDAEKRKELVKDLNDARKEADEKIPDLFREVADKHPDTPSAFDAATNLLRMAVRLKLTADEATKLVKLVQKQAAPYGPLFGGVALAAAAETLAGQPGLEAVALAAIEPAAKALSKDDPTFPRLTVLTAYQTALDKSGKGDAAKALGKEIDAEYLKAVPPFKPAAFTGRKDKSANQVAVMELFTGAQCPPCVAADVAFDALLKTYKPTDVVLIQYHVHIPGPDPLTIPDSVARFSYYQKEFPEAVRGAPTSVFNGKPQTGGGGAMAASEAKYKQYVDVINPLLEKTTEVKVAGKATRTGDKIDIATEVVGAEGEDMKLRLLVVEENIGYVGGNQIRFHHQVVRAMPGGAEGVAIKDKAFKHTASTDLGDVKKALGKYLDDFAKTRPFPKADRPMDMKNLKVIALVQNDKTKEIVQAVQIDVDSKAVGGGGER